MGPQNLGAAAGHYRVLKTECWVKKQIQGNILWEIQNLEDFDFKPRPVGDAKLLKSV